MILSAQRVGISGADARLSGVITMDIEITVEQALQSDGFKDSVILAGKAGLNRKIGRITVAELPDTMNWLQGGELVCSTAFFLKDNPEAQNTWIIEMAKREVAALAIKPERFIGQVPQSMIQLAEERQFPLISLPLSVTWPEIIRGVMELMLQIQTERLSQSLQIHDKLTELVLTSKGLESIINTIADLIVNPVILEDRHFNLLAIAQPKGFDQMDAINARLSESSINALKNHPYFVKNGTWKQKDLLREVIATEAGPLNQLVMPVVAGNDLFGWLTSLLVNRAEQTFDSVALEHGSTVLALELVKEKASLEARSRVKTDFLRSVLEDDYASDKEMQKKANLLGIDLIHPTMVLILDLESGINLKCHKNMEDLIKLKDAYGSAISTTKDIVVFFHPKNFADQDATFADASSMAKALVAFISKFSGQCHVGIGRCYQHTLEIKRSYYEAKQAVTLATKSDRPIILYPEMGLYRLLSLVGDRTELKYLCEDTLGKLIDYDAKHNSSFLETLSCYLKFGSNRAKTARELHLHVNSLNYRLGRIQELLKMDLNDPESCLFLNFSINFRDYYQHEDL